MRREAPFKTNKPCYGSLMTHTSSTVAFCSCGLSDRSPEEKRNDDFRECSPVAGREFGTARMGIQGAVGGGGVVGELARLNGLLFRPGPPAGAVAAALA